MNMDRMIFIGISVFTVVILGIIVFTSFSTSVDLKPETFLTEGTHFKGPDNAKVTVVEFSDFECPFCAQFGLSVDSLLNTYPELRIAYKHFPLPIHQRAFPAAVAAEAAGKQGKFWEYARELFSNQPNFSAADLEKYATNVKIDPEQLKKDVQSNELINKVKADMELGNKLKINATPTFYLIVDGKVEKVRLSQANDLENAIKRYINPRNPSSSNSSEPSMTIDTTQPDVNQQIGRNIQIDTIINKNKSIKQEDQPQVRKIIDKFLTDNKIVTVDKITIKSVEKVDFPSPALGCEAEGTVAIQVITPGYKTIINDGTKDYDYRSDMGNNIKVCTK